MQTFLWKQLFISKGGPWRGARISIVKKVRQVFCVKMQTWRLPRQWNRYSDNIVVTTTISVFITTRWFSMCSSVENDIWIFIAFSKSQCPPLLSSLQNFFMSEVTMLGMQGQRIAGQRPPLVGRWNTNSNAPRRLNAEGWACLQLLQWLLGLKILMAKEPKHAQKKWNNSLINFAVPLIWQQIKCLENIFSWILNSAMPLRIYDALRQHATMHLISMELEMDERCEVRRGSGNMRLSVVR